MVIQQRPKREEIQWSHMSSIEVHRVLLALLFPVSLTPHYNQQRRRRFGVPLSRSVARQDPPR
jgi:hypothetical protein